MSSRTRSRSSTGRDRERRTATARSHSIDRQVVLDDGGEGSRRPRRTFASSGSADGGISERRATYQRNREHRERRLKEAGGAGEGSQRMRRSIALDGNEEDTGAGASRRYHRRTISADGVEEDDGAGESRRYQRRTIESAASGDEGGTISRRFRRTIDAAVSGDEGPIAGGSRRLNRRTLDVGGASGDEGAGGSRRLNRRTLDATADDNATTRSNRKALDTIGTPDDASAASGRSGGSGYPSRSRDGTMDHEEELERIREARARRLRGREQTREPHQVSVAVRARSVERTKARDRSIDAVRERRARRTARLGGAEEGLTRSNSLTRSNRPPLPSPRLGRDGTAATYRARREERQRDRDRLGHSSHHGSDHGPPPPPPLPPGMDDSSHSYSRASRNSFGDASARSGVSDSLRSGSPLASAKLAAAVDNLDNISVKSGDDPISAATKLVQEREQRRRERRERRAAGGSSDIAQRILERREREQREKEEGKQQGDNEASESIDGAPEEKRPTAAERLSNITSRKAARDAEKLKESGATPKAKPKSIALPSKKERAISIINPDNDAQLGAIDKPERIPELEFSSDEEEEIDVSAHWSIRVCVVSAVDLPINVIPNTPLCPVVKFGLVKIPESPEAIASPEMVHKRLGSRGVAGLRTARTRATSDKILSKRDNGSVEFHQELRWDCIKHPMQTALCIELCAQAVRTPRNFQESPKVLAKIEAESEDEDDAGSDQASTDDFKESMKLSKSENSLDTAEEEDARASSRSALGLEEEIGAPMNPGGGGGGGGKGGGGLRALWRKATNRKAAELEAANKAAAVARMLVEAGNDDETDENASTDEAAADTTEDFSKINEEAEVAAKKAVEEANLAKLAAAPPSELNVALRSQTGTRRQDMTDDMRLGTLVVPLIDLPLSKATNDNEAARVEQWYQLESTEEHLANTPQFSSVRKKKPSLLLEISFSSPDILDDSEDEMDEDSDNDESDVYKPRSLLNASYFRRAAMASRNIATVDKQPEENKTEDPLLEPGVIDFVAVVGATDIGTLKNDTGEKGWVEASPKAGVLEQFPPNDEFHQSVGRNVALPNMIEWFCFPEGCRLWRGTSPPNHTDLNFKRFSAASTLHSTSSIAAFDACLNCTTSITWFVIASNSDEYGSKLVKTYGTCIRFYAPAPLGIDYKQEGFVQSLADGNGSSDGSASQKRLWVPLGICLTSNLPIVGIMEAMLLRTCEELVARTRSSTNDPPDVETVHKCLSKLILNFQKPIAGAVNCSIPFLSGQRFLLSLPPPTGLPAMPHGRAVTSVCRLLGAEGLNFMLAAVLTESKILIHSNDLADITMVAEVVTSLTYPFSWSLPYIPILPVDMLEFVEAPLSYLLGIPTCNLKHCDPNALEEVVVIDLNTAISPADGLDGRKLIGMKNVTLLPANVANNISKAVYRLLRTEDELEEEFGNANHSNLYDSPHVEPETLAEREFRITVAFQISSMLRGYQSCTGPVFNRDKFLKTSPALYDDRNDALKTVTMSQRGPLSRPVSIRSKRFLSALVNTQNFHQLLESLDFDDAAFFHEIMETFDDAVGDISSRAVIDIDSPKVEKILSTLHQNLQRVEDKIPTYRVDQNSSMSSISNFDHDNLSFDEDLEIQDFEYCFNNPEALAAESTISSHTFTDRILRKSDISFTPESPSPDENSQSFSRYIDEIEKSPWSYQKLFDVKADRPMSNGEVKGGEKVKLRDAIGERRYRAWKIVQDQKLSTDSDLHAISEELNGSKQGASLDLKSLLTSATDDMTDASSISSSNTTLYKSDLSPEQQRVLDAKNRDVIRRCLDRAQGDDDSFNRKGGDAANLFFENGRDLIGEAEIALQNPSAMRFLLSVLGQRSRLEHQRNGRHMRRQSGLSNQASVSRLETIAFECLVRLSCAMLDACMEYKDFEPAYRLLTQTAGFVMVVRKDGDDDDDERESQIKQIISMTSRIGLHPIFADIGVWIKVMSLHLTSRKNDKKSDDAPTDRMAPSFSDDDDDDAMAYEAAVATLYEMLGYGIPGEELSRFATRASEENGWFCDERGKQLLMLARRISVRRELTDTGAAATSTGDINVIRPGQEASNGDDEKSLGYLDSNRSWSTIGWCHPAAPPSRQSRSQAPDSFVPSADAAFVKRSAITAVAAFDSSVIATGGLDGGVFLAHSIPRDFACSSEESGNNEESDINRLVQGIHLDWGSASRATAGSSSDGEYGVGAVSCLAAAGGQSATGSPVFEFPGGKDTGGDTSVEEILASMEGSRVVAGTTAGDLRVWSVKDVYSSVIAARQGDQSDFGPVGALSRTKFLLRGRALSGHRGGVTSIDVPSHVYRADSLVTGGADGLIKLWSLRAPTSGRRNAAGSSDAESNTQQRGRGGDALSILNGHSGRVLCVKTAWHGDRLLSGGADRTVRIWDMSSNASGKCLHTLHGHIGWVTKVQYWGPNTIVTTSTDRSLALWDARVRSSPLFVLRHHQSPISDVMVGLRTDPLMVSSAADGTVATWDFRALTSGENTTGKDADRHCRVVRRPAAIMRHEKRRIRAAGPVHLARGVVHPSETVLSIGNDAICREWDIATGQLIEESPTGHCDSVTSFQSFGHDSEVTPDIGSNCILNDGMITTSWDGTVRIKKLRR